MAVPFDVAQPTVIACAIGRVSESESVATLLPESPSITARSAIEIAGGRSSSRIVPTACGSNSTAFELTLARLTKKVSLSSWNVSPLTSTVIVVDVLPAATTAGVPGGTSTKSMPPWAVPGEVLQVKVTSSAIASESVTVKTKGV